MSDAINVLDHGFVRLVDSMGGDVSVARAARVSYDAAWRAGEDQGSDAKLIRYLWANHHSTPFEAVTFTFEVKAPIFVIRQWHRHRTWCLSGDSQLEFIRPVDGKPYKVSLSRLESSWNPRTAKRRRKDQSPLSLEEWNRMRIQGMRLRCRGKDGSITETRILDVWKSGSKPMFEIKAGGRTIKASADHKFYSQGEWIPVADLPRRKVTLLGFSGTPVERKFPLLSPGEIESEEWSEFAPGYRVSTLGRLQTKWGQGARSQREDWRPKKITLSSCDRAVVSVKSRVLQVSRLVAESFLPDGEKFVLHRNDNPLDNRISNLRRGTAADNQKDSWRNGSRAVRSWQEFDVESITPVGEMECYDVSVEHPEHNFVANNFLVHNCYNEVSARYKELPSEYYVPTPKTIGVQSSSSKQAREVGEIDEETHRRRYLECHDYRMACMDSFAKYRKLLEAGWPRELARAVLPVATYTHMFATVNLLNLLKFLTLRIHPHAQMEIRVYAEAMLELIRPIVPVCVGAWEAGREES